MPAIVLIILLISSILQAETIFRYAIPTQPHSLDPTETITTDSQHLLGAIYRGLYRFDEKGKLKPEGVRRCQWESNLILRCHLKNLKYSDGSPVTANHYVASFRHFLRKDSKTPEIEVLMKLKNAPLFHEGKSDALGVKAESDKTLLFEFQEPDPEFEYKLSSPLFFPWKAPPSIQGIEQAAVNGPFRVKEWGESKILLEPNPFFEGGHPKRPNLEVRFIPDENTVLNMFDSKRLDFIRRLPTLSIKKYEKHPGFLARPLSRFDYLGFGPRLKELPELRKAMTSSLDYDEFRRIFDSLGRPGCPSFPISYLDQLRCYDFKAKSTPAPPPFRMKFRINQTGGEDLRRGAEWFQAQWKKHLSLAIDVEAVEGRIFLSELRINPPDIFRLGVPLTRPTCLAALELFHSNDPNNLIDLKDAEYDRLITRLGQVRSIHEKKKYCGQALQRLLDLHVLIPLGRFQFFMVVSDQFKGLQVNELNHLDLSQLHPVSISK